LSKFKILNKRINKITQSLIANQELCKLLVYYTHNPLDMPNIEDTTTLLYENIYPYMVKVPEDKEKVFVTIILDDFYKKDGEYVVNNKIIVNVLCHSNLWRIDEGLRPFAIMEQIDNIFNDTTNAGGIGKTQFSGSNFMTAEKDYTGYRITYDILSWN
jgi:hypothetical protein